MISRGLGINTLEKRLEALCRLAIFLDVLAF